MKDTGFKGAAPTDQWLTIPAIYEKVAAAVTPRTRDRTRGQQRYESSPGGERVDLRVDPVTGEDQLGAPTTETIPFRIGRRLLHRPMPVVFGNENDSSNRGGCPAGWPKAEAQLKLDADNGDLDWLPGSEDHGDRN